MPTKGEHASNRVSQHGTGHHDLFPHPAAVVAHDQYTTVWHDKPPTQHKQITPQTKTKQPPKHEVHDKTLTAVDTDCWWVPLRRFQARSTRTLRREAEP